MTVHTLCAALAALCFFAIAAEAGETRAAAIELFQFQPKDVVVTAGTTVTWANGDGIEHSVTAGTPGGETGDFDSGFLTKGGSFAHTFSAPGSYRYFCKRHPSMTATVTVTR
jgi:plastocyanin